MKYLIMCEGPNELAIIKMLLEHDKLMFTEDDLLNLVPYHARQIGKILPVSWGCPCFENRRQIK